MTIGEIIALVVAAIVGVAVPFSCKWINRHIKEDIKEDMKEVIKPVEDRLDKYKEDIDDLKAGQQENLKHDLVEDWHLYVKERGYATDEEKRAWETRYERYHKLGANGVMDRKREQVLDLPETEEEK